MGSNFKLTLVDFVVWDRSVGIHLEIGEDKC